MPPYWAFGWHMSNFGHEQWNSINSFDLLVSKHREYNLPIDSIWFDTDTLNFTDFTVPYQVDKDYFTQFVDQKNKDGIFVCVHVNGLL